MLKSVCVFCGSSSGVKAEYAHAAQAVGRLLAERRLELVFGGGRVGLMGLVADAALASGGRVFGVIPTALATVELAHTGLTEMRVVDNMHERKAEMARRADAFIALPGGFGTFEEFCEVLTWAQLKFHGKPCAILNVLGYYDPLLAMFDHAVAEGFLRAEHRALVISGNDPAELLDRIQAVQQSTHVIDEDAL